MHYKVISICFPVINLKSVFCVFSIKVCFLGGEFTEIGEKGVTLSGGQVTKRESLNIKSIRFVYFFSK